MSKERRNEIKNKNRNQKAAVLVAAVLAVVIIAGAVVAFNVHKCDDCQKVFFGSGYYKEKESEGVLGSLFGSLFGDTESIPLETVEGVVICGECVKNNVSVKAELRDIKEFKR